MGTAIHLTPAPECDAVFRHQPLDHSEPSIRLVHILPALSHDGRVQCSIIHTNVQAAYVCLSYRWGDPDPSRDILMDGKSFSVGQNLFGFLSAARERVASGTATADIGPYWIDAVCIDQSNVLELNHQVLQMGMIYRNASETILWPGSMPPELLPFVSIFLKGGSDTIGKVRAAYLCRKDFAEFILRNKYWTRAWIVQEVMLARRVTIWIGAASIDLKSMEQMLARVNIRYELYPHFARLLHAHTRREQFQDKSLIHLLDHYREKQCLDPRDRVYSLLSLASCNGSNLEVDYHISRVGLAAEVLQRCEGTLCICTAILVVQTLELGDADFLRSQPCFRSSPCLEFCIILTEPIKPLKPFKPFQNLGLQDKPVSPGFTFLDTCDSAHLYYSKLMFSLNAVSRGQGLCCDNTGLAEQTVLQEHGVEFNSVEGLEHVYVVRVRLLLLAVLMDKPLKICEQAKRQVCKRKGLPVGFPRILASRPSMPQLQTIHPSLPRIGKPEHLFEKEDHTKWKRKKVLPKRESWHPPRRLRARASDGIQKRRHGRQAKSIATTRGFETMHSKHKARVHNTKERMRLLTGFQAMMLKNGKWRVL